MGVTRNFKILFEISLLIEDYADCCYYCDYVNIKRTLPELGHVRF